MSQEKSQTDLDRLDNMSDEEIDTSDIPPLGEEFFKKAVLRLPTDRPEDPDAPKKA